MAEIKTYKWGYSYDRDTSILIDENGDEICEMTSIKKSIGYDTHKFYQRFCRLDTFLIIDKKIEALNFRNKSGFMRYSGVVLNTRSLRFLWSLLS